jgi:hypothetical protein
VLSSTQNIFILCGQNENMWMLNLVVHIVTTVLGEVKSPSAVLRMLSGKELMFARHANMTTRADLKR